MYKSHHLALYHMWFQNKAELHTNSIIMNNQYTEGFTRIHLLEISDMLLVALVIAPRTSESVPNGK